MVYAESSDSANCAKVQCASVSKTNRLACGCVASMPFEVNSSIDSAYTRASIACVLVTVVKLNLSVYTVFIQYLHSVRTVSAQLRGSCLDYTV